MKSHSCSFWYKIIKSGCSPGVGRLPWEQEAARSNRATRTNASGTAVPEAFFAISLFTAVQILIGHEWSVRGARGLGQSSVDLQFCWAWFAVPSRMFVW